ncbi:MAG TPA: hypothetical protein VGM90_26630 [Kofleriaceae bacterium]
MLFRWLLPIVAMFALLGNAVSAFAAAGTHRVTSCCCPDPDHCLCGDRGPHKDNDRMNRCGGDSVKVEPVQVASTTCECVEQVIDVVTAVIAPPALLVLSDRTLAPPEPPPF